MIKRHISLANVFILANKILFYFFLFQIIALCTKSIFILRLVTILIRISHYFSVCSKKKKKKEAFLSFQTKVISIQIANLNLETLK